MCYLLTKVIIIVIAAVIDMNSMIELYIDIDAIMMLIG